ncbi:MAG: DNA polymerase III subunit delta [Ignavibacteriaceae bacterium]
MAKNKVLLPSISEAIKSLRSKKFLPVYFFSGEDEFGIEEAIKTVEETVAPFITSDFDKETIYGEENDATGIINIATAFPFGSEKKLIILKEFEKLKDKKKLISYLNFPADFTILVLVQNSSLSSIETEPYKTLYQKKFIFEAKELKGKNLVDWLKYFVEENGKEISYDNAQMLVDIAGENRNLIEAQLEKIFINLGDKKQITIESVRSLTAALKEYTIFDLQNALGKKNKKDSLKIAFNLLENGSEPTQIVGMINRYFTQLTRVGELAEKQVTSDIGARIIGTHRFYYPEYIKARNLYKDEGLFRAAAALLKADLAIKTTSLDEKSLISLLIAEILA